MIKKSLIINKDVNIKSDTAGGLVFLLVNVCWFCREELLGEMREKGKPR